MERSQYIITPSTKQDKIIGYTGNVSMTTWNLFECLPVDYKNGIVVSCCECLDVAAGKPNSSREQHKTMHLINVIKRSSYKQ